MTSSSLIMLLVNVGARMARRGEGACSGLCRQGWLAIGILMLQFDGLLVPGILLLEIPLATMGGALAPADQGRRPECGRWVF